MPLQNLTTTIKHKNGKKFSVHYVVVGDLSNNTVLKFAGMDFSYLSSSATFNSVTSGNFSYLTSLSMEYFPAHQERGFVIIYNLQTAGACNAVLSAALLVLLAFTIFS
uniref:Lectin_legB domain-containing protein n=1 Tax=Steinernema glaseri TaxID=37863 RepID=A0A1I7Y1U1_9BILA